MNTNDPNASNQKPSQNPAENRPIEPTPVPTTPPPSSPTEPTHPYPSDSSKNYATEPLDTARISGDEQRSSETQTQKERETFEDKTDQPSGKKDETSKKKDFFTYATSNKEQSIAYILLILGLLLLLFFNTLLGGLIIGMVAGYFFSADIIYYLRNLNLVFGRQNHLRYVVLTALLLGLFIAAPGIFIGAIIVATFKQVMAGPNA